MRWSWGLLTFCAFVFGSASARANDDTWTPSDFENPAPGTTPRPTTPPPPEPRRDLESRSAPFGARGQVMIFGDSSLGGSGNLYESDARNFSVGVDVTAAYFVATNLAVGLDALASYGDSRGYNALGDFFRETYGGGRIGPMLAYNIRLGRRVSILPRLSFEIGAQSLKAEPISGNPVAVPRSNTELDIAGSAYLPLVVHPVQHLFIGFGPSVSHHFGTTRDDIDVGTENTTLGAWFVVGGYFGGDTPTDDTPLGAPRRFQKRFGDYGTTEITNGVDLQAFDTIHPRSGTTSQSFDTSLALDYFAADRVSIGAGLEMGYLHDEGIDPLRKELYVIDSDVFSLQLRTQYDLRLGPSFALVPRARLSLSLTDYNSRIDTHTNNHSSGSINAGLLVPFVAEVADHFLLGLGPYVNQDLANDDGYTENRRTSFGLESLVGGWW